MAEQRYQAVLAVIGEGVSVPVSQARAATYVQDNPAVRPADFAQGLGLATLQGI